MTMTIKEVLENIDIEMEQLKKENENFSQRIWKLGNDNVKLQTENKLLKDKLQKYESAENLQLRSKLKKYESDEPEYCDVSGVKLSKKVKCEECQGYGDIKSYDDLTKQIVRIIYCKMCNGTGFMWE